MEAIKDLITCGICLEIYTDPHVLSCLHTLCAGCIKEIRKNSEVMCPECRSISKIKAIKKNFHTQSLIDVYYANARPVSARARMKSKQGCEICAKGAIDKKCMDCDKLICAECCVSHGSIPSCSDHVLVELSVISDQSRTRLEDLKTRLETLSKACKGKGKEISKYTEKLRTARKAADATINDSEEEAVQKVRESHDEARSAMKSALLLEEKKLGKFGQHVKFAGSEIEEMLDLITEVTNARIDPARLVHATAELCDGVEGSLADLDVSTIQVGDMEVTVKPATIVFSNPVACDVEHVKETCNVRDATVSFQALVKATLKKEAEVKIEDGAVVKLYAFGKLVIALQKTAVLYFSLDGVLKNKVQHESLQNARGLTKLFNEHIAIVCGASRSADAQLHLFTFKGDYKEILAKNDFCDVTAVGKKLYALSHIKHRISIFATNSQNKWVVTGSIALDVSDCSGTDTIASTSVSVLVGHSKDGRIEEFTHSGEPMKDVLYPGDTTNHIDVSEERNVRLGPTDHAGASIIVNTKTGILKVLDSHRKWLDFNLPITKHGKVSCIAVDAKGRVWTCSNSHLICFKATK